MKISVLMPVYRTDERILRETIESVLAQTFTDFEFLILDDCPTDSREGVVGSFRDSRIVYLRNETNRGITPSRNRLMDLARGEYLAVLDHDDVCDPSRFAKQAAYLDSHPECGVVSSWIRRIPDGGTSEFPEDDLHIKLGMMARCTLQHSASMIRKSLLEKTGVRYEERFSPTEEYAMWMKLIPHTTFHNLQEPLLSYRRHADNTTRLRAADVQLAERRCRAWARIHLPELYAEYEIDRREVSRVRLFGIPLLKCMSEEKRTDVRLFGVIPFLRLDRKDV